MASVETSDHPVSLANYQHERLATRLTFFSFGFAMSAWAPIIPIIKQRFSLDDGSLGFLLLCFGLGSIVALPLSGAATARFGIRATILVASITVLTTFPLLLFLPSIMLLSTALFLFGGGIGAIDCVVNIQGIEVERLCNRKMMSGFHGLFSVGGICGPTLVSSMLSYGASLITIAITVMLIIAAVTIVAFKGLIGQPIDKDGALFALPRGPVLIISLFCFIVFLIEGAMLDWSAVLLVTHKAIDVAQAGFGYTAFALAMTIGRLTGDYWVRLLGAQRLTVFGSLISAIGLFGATILPDWHVTLGCYFLVGLGVSNLAPIFFSAAGDQKVMPEHLAVAAIASIGYSGILIGPAILGFVAHAGGLETAFLILSALMASVSLSYFVLGRPQSQ